MYARTPFAAGAEGPAGPPHAAVVIAAAAARRRRRDLAIALTLAPPKKQSHRGNMPRWPLHAAWPSVKIRQRGVWPRILRGRCQGRIRRQVAFAWSIRPRAARRCERRLTRAGVKGCRRNLATRLRSLA